MENFNFEFQREVEIIIVIVNIIIITIIINYWLSCDHYYVMDILLEVECSLLSGINICSEIFPLLYGLNRISLPLHKTQKN